MDESKLKRNSTYKSNVSDLEIKRLNSFYNNMNIFAPGIFEKGPQQKQSVFNSQNNSVVQKEQQHGNVFTGFRPQEPQKVMEVKANTSQNYQRQCLEYEKYLFDSRIKTIIKRMAVKAYSIFKSEKQGQFFVFPIQRLLVAIAKKMLLNRFELLFLQYVFQETKWHYDIECIRKHVVHFKSYIMMPDSEISNENLKMVEIYILYCAYFSKKSLNELQSDNMFIIFAQDICFRFKQLFSQWTQKLTIFQKINPKQLNAIFKRLNNNLQVDHQEIQNYCLLVQEIIDISPAYNADKSGKQKKSRKKKKDSQVNKEEEEEDQGIQSHEIKSSSNNNIHPIVQQQDSLDYQNYPLLKAKKSSVLSVDLLQANHYITRKSSQQSQNDRKL